jgi:sialic acid synthase SpsE
LKQIKNMLPQATEGISSMIDQRRRATTWVERRLSSVMLQCKTSYPSPTDLESLGSTLSGVIEQAESGDIG